MARDSDCKFGRISGLVNTSDYYDEMVGVLCPIPDYTVTKQLFYLDVQSRLSFRYNIHL